MGEKIHLLQHNIEEREKDDRWKEIKDLKEKASKLRKDITWQTIRIANIPVGAKGLCAICHVSNVNVLHIFTHSNLNNNNPNGLPTRLANILTQKNSVELLKLENQQDLKDLWILYKNYFSI